MNPSLVDGPLFRALCTTVWVFRIVFAFAASATVVGAPIPLYLLRSLKPQLGWWFSIRMRVYCSSPSKTSSPHIAYAFLFLTDFSGVLEQTAHPPLTLWSLLILAALMVHSSWDLALAMLSPQNFSGGRLDSHAFRNDCIDLPAHDCFTNCCPIEATVFLDNNISLM